ncbi:MAG: peptide ABC transporter substrate-binding protein [Betaproteobacteria bacterium]|nr:peptide ABC transporter substrate-binding protein [Betaproteobacteria bacterium]
MVMVGISAPMAAQLLMHAGIAQAQQYKSAYTPSKRGGGGPLRVLWWQGPTLLNPHFATGTKDQEGSRIFYEPLAAWDTDGNLVPILAAEVPSTANKTVAPDGKWVIWKLKQGVRWHDGKPFTADDVVFTAAFAADPASAAVTISTYQDVKVTKIDNFTVRVENTRASPFWADPLVGTAGMIIPKHLFEPYIGRTGLATANFLNNPSRFVSKNMKYEFNPDKAAATLEAAGWKRGSDGVRTKDGKRLKFVFQTSINAPRQKTQQIVKQAAQKAGIDLELKSVTASVFFSSDVANPDTYTKFFCDVQMYTTTMTQPDPELFMNQFVSTNASSRANKWQGRNITRWVNAEYDATHKAAESEQDPIKRAALFIKMNDLAVSDYTVIPVVARPRVAGMSLKLNAPLSAWDNDLWMLRDWFREA